MDWEMDVNRRKQNFKDKIDSMRGTQEVALAPRIVAALVANALPPIVGPSTTGPSDIDFALSTLCRHQLCRRST